jgi:Xaa-Pro aminopeptidase
MGKSIYKNRRKKLLEKLHELHPEVDGGVVLLFAGLEQDGNPFLQESSFYYLTGINEPGVVFALYSDGRETLYSPNYGRARDQWVTSCVGEQEDVEQKLLGEKCEGYWLKPYFREKEYSNLISDLKQDYLVFGLLDKSNENYFTQIYRLENLTSRAIDISPIVAQMRRKKDERELKLIEQAIAVTYRAHDRVAEIIKPGMYEYEIQAEIEKVFTCNQASVAFPSIVASGKNTTVLHYISRDQKLEDNDMLVVDIGARVGHYCADITRTYPVSGKFSLRQKEIYDIVRDLQVYVSSLAKPGVFLINKEAPENSLHHLACEFLKKLGYDKYFVHGIGHFLGLDVHDVGGSKIAPAGGLNPLGEGDVITIEPGIYLPDENIGVRIEDDFLITPDGCKKLGFPNKF